MNHDGYWSNTDRRSLSRDPLYELEMCRALLADARRQPNQNEVLVRGLESEVAWWMKRAVKVCQQ